MISLAEVKEYHEIKAYMEKGHEYLGTMGAIEHSYRHIDRVAINSKKILSTLGFHPRTAELGAIAGYLHDLGNFINRYNHGRNGALVVRLILQRMNMSLDEITMILPAIGNHEEQTGVAVTPITAAVIIADKVDVHGSRVRKRDISSFTTRDRVNYAAKHSELEIEDGADRVIRMKLEIDTKVCSVMEYFEIFMTKMVLCRRAAEKLECRFELVINGDKLL
ncbi:HD domain-containing protein [Metallumcola ferriviriculae]|uniref:HD domain-containing protein n=1 Tax=Metallumcola ferriviriculae TaxID=3039180 RepID=A0AAU0UMZ4_9FIRM|nr:HD domain-containing protein [Desulfitibacteraceae bacterium MK1]